MISAAPASRPGVGTSPKTAKFDGTTWRKIEKPEEAWRYLSTAIEREFGATLTKYVPWKRF